MTEGKIQNGGKKQGFMCPAAAVVAIVLMSMTAEPVSKAAPPKSEKVVLHGKVMTLTAALNAVGIESRVDADVTDRQVVVVGDDRSIVPLLSDEASRALFLDERLRGKRAEIHSTRFAGVPYVRVSTFRIEWDGRLETPEYFCTVCSISVGFPQICPCCQGAMELRMKPDHR